MIMNGFVMSACWWKSGTWISERFWFRFCSVNYSKGIKSANDMQRMKSSISIPAQLILLSSGGRTILQTKKMNGRVLEEMDHGERIYNI
jgi:hypothetical protein